MSGGGVETKPITASQVKDALKKPELKLTRAKIPVSSAGTEVSADTEVGDKKIAMPINTAPADKLFSWLMRNGVNWIDRPTFDSWYLEASKNGKVSLSEIRGLLGGKIGLFTKLFFPSSFSYVRNITDKAWDGFIGNSDGKADDEVEVDTLLDKLDDTSAMGAMQGKDIWGMLETNKIIWLNTEYAGKGVMDFYKGQVTKKIKNDITLDDKKKTYLIEKACGCTKDGVYQKGYLDNIDSFTPDYNFDGTITLTIKNTDLEGKPYDYFGGDEFKDSETLNYLTEAYKQTYRLKGDKTGKMYSLAGLNMLFGAGFSIKSVFNEQRLHNPTALITPNAYGAVSDILSNIKDLTDKGKKLEGDIVAENGKGKKDEGLLKTLEDKKQKNDELLKLYGKFYTIIGMVCKAGSRKTTDPNIRADGKDYNKILEDEGFQVKDEGFFVKRPRTVTLKDVLCMFTNADRLWAQIEKLPPKPAEKTDTTSGKMPIAKEE